ncbi:SNF2 family N-terminal domain-containing protein [Ilyonectria robusta]|uniref:SNF2 family N-terminal domain-containing protein n=1 Tax=Ilyonectria robusta TaxID=1079257 RepID=UPI001E8D5E88|nr:SNF2 family N-terminal domain-containing protein [Ilyonectria robusta]KAH8677143.1 SNF2 family N-terminal domain-containing protein [Ilyonectria robusta]
MDVAALTEELTIQKVILDSLQNETFEGVEEERFEIRQEIDRLKKLLRFTKPRDHADEPTLPPALPTRPRANRTPVGPSPVYEPPEMPVAMSTPVKNSSAWNDLGSRSVPSRKRDSESASLFAPVGPNKSRRTTPIRASDPFFHSSSLNGNGSHVDVIDLTGDDDDLNSYFVAQQIKAEKTRKQEREDHELARLLSSQGSPVPGPSTLPAETNAFTRLMGSQPSGIVETDLTDGDSESSFGAPFTTSVLGQSTNQMPGGYDPTWDATVPLRQASHMPPANSMARGYGPVVTTPQAPTFGAYGAAGSTVPYPTYQSGIPPQNMGQIPNQLSGPTPIPGYKFEGRPGPTFGGSSNASWIPGSRSTPILPSQGMSGGLADIITKTNMFDYTNGMDGAGNALPEHLTNFIQDAYHDPRMTDQDLDNLLQNIRPDMDIPERNRDGTPAGLKRPLYPHQEVALTWMKKMEEGTNKGGILADDMGLGKTISTLALLLSRPATSRPKTNLIVGPVALIRQWEEELATKTKLSHRLSVFLYHNKKATTEDLLKYDVVLTTYGTIAQELKRLEKYLEDNKDRNIDFNDKSFAVKCPLLHPNKAKFYRVILDEAQCIKNKDTKTSKACTKLKSTYRWCLTGTPMMNGVLELYSLLNFLQIKPYSAWEQFRQSFGVLFGRNGDPKSVAMNRLRALLKAIMLRRKKNSQLDGKPILKLPEKIEQVVYAELSPEEHDFYSQLEKKSQVQFSKYLRDGSIGKNYSSILVLLLRLRQACCHPHLNLDVDDVSPVSDEEKVDLVKALDVAIVERIKGIEAFECPICYDAVQCPTFFVPCGHDSCNECLCRLTENATVLNLQEGNEGGKAKCPVCRGTFDPSKCFNYETFQKIHMPECVEKAESGGEASGDDDDEDDESDSDDFISDDEVDKQGNLKGFIVADEDDDDEKPDKKALDKGKKKKKNKGKKKASDIRPSMLKTLRKEGYKNRDAFKKYMRYLRKTWMPAAKVTECMKLLTTIAETGEKTIIFSQWTLLLDLLEVAMWHEKMAKPERYDGSMSAMHRNIAAHNFRDRKDVKVMLVSLRAGNAGLNLTAASRVIIMDPFWNPYIEMQAVDRAYRIGQQKEVKVYRILTKDTVEDRIVALQEKKKSIVEAALDEAESVKIGRLSTNELKFLFNARG